MIRAITLDFGNTLVPVSAAGLRGVVAHTAAAMADGLGPFDVDEVLRAWGEERERQFREEVPQFREVDLAQRVVRILARLRGMAPPPPDRRWDDAAAARLSTPDEVAWAVEVYSRGFVAALPPAPAAGALLERLAGPYRLAILSNWPLAATIDRYVEAAGWAPHLAAVVVSQRVGTIKPHPAIFAAARTALGDPAPAADPPRGRRLGGGRRRGEAGGLAGGVAGVAARGLAAAGLGAGRRGRGGPGARRRSTDLGAPAADASRRGPESR